MWWSHAVEYYLAIKRNEEPIHVVLWMNLGEVMQGKRNQSEYHMLYDFHLYGVSRMYKSWRKKVN